MGIMVVAGATVQCAMGTALASVQVTSQNTLMAGGKLAATIKDCAPFINIPTCGMCSSMLNPQVAAATAAALGVLTPQPCIPSTTASWMPTQLKCLAGGIPCLSNDSKLLCTYGGIITITNPGQSIIII